MPKEEFSGAEIVLKALKDQGVDTVFGYPGGVTLPLYDEIYKQNFLRHILTRHEQGAMHAAEGYARSTGKVGVALVTSGPGATNTVTGLTDAMMDSIPLVCLTGQVPTGLIGNDAFQEADITGITRACTKHNYLVKDVADLARVMHEAFFVAANGRPGPVLIDLPKDVLMDQAQYIEPAKAKPRSYKPQVKGDAKAIEKAVKMMAKAKRPIIYAGGGVINSGPKASKLLTELVAKTGFPVTLTLMGLGAVPASDPRFLGMLGMHGTYESNMAMHGSDFMLCVGARFDDRVTGALDSFAPQAKKVHIDIDPSSINKNILVDVGIVGDVGAVLGEMMKQWKALKAVPDGKALKNWWADIDTWRARKCLSYKKSGKMMRPQFVLEQLREACQGKDVFFTTDVGQHQMWSAQYLNIEKPNHWMTSGGLGTMGYGMPAALGVQVAHPKSVVVCVSSECSIQMNLQEFATAVQYGLPVKVVLLNNGFMGMVRQWQELFYGERYSETRMEVHPDFVKLAEAFGALGIKVEKSTELKKAYEKMLAYDGPVIIDARIDPTENVFPMIPAGHPHNDMILGPGDTVETANDEEDVVLA